MSILPNLELECLMSQLTLKDKPKETTKTPANLQDTSTSTPAQRDTLSISAWIRLVKKPIGDEAWEAASTILIYQRYQNLGPQHAYAAIKNDLECGFILQRKEIPQMLANHRFFASCSESFTLFVSKNYNGAATTQTSFTKNDVLPAKLFCEVWLTSFYFEYENITSLARLKTLSTQEYADFSLICRIIRDNHNSPEFGCVPRDKCGLFEDYRSSGLFSISFFADILLDSDYESYEVNPALYLKMITQLRATYTSLDGDFLPTLVDFMMDYPRMATEELVEKYKLDKGAKYVAQAELEQEWGKAG